MSEVANNTPEFSIQKIYVRDASFESPLAPSIFQQEWKPEVDIELHTRAEQIAAGVHEIILSVTVTAKANGKTAFLVEVKQAGIFTVNNFPADQLGPMLGSFCPNILFPYIREEISNLVVRGGFPPLYLAPVNFDALYAQHMKQQTETAKKAAEESKG